MATKIKYAPDDPRYELTDDLTTEEFNRRVDLYNKEQVDDYNAEADVYNARIDRSNRKRN